MVKNYITRFRIYLLALIPVFVTTFSLAQTITYPVGNPGGIDERRPYGVYFGHERMQAIYLEGASELNLPVGSIITSLSFYLSSTNNPPGSSYPVKIYMREVASPTVTASTVPPFEIPANLVWQGNLTPADWTGGPHWITEPLTYAGAPLVTTGSNLEIFVETDWQNVNTCCGWFPQAGNPNNITFSHNAKASSAQWWQNDNAVNNGLTGSIQANRPNIQLTFVAAAPCSTAVTGVTAMASPNPTCAVPFNLSLSGVPPVSGLSFQWQSGPTVGGPWTNIAGATSPFYSITQGVTTSYQCVITCSCCGGLTSNSTVVTVIQNPPTGCYCANNATFTGDTDIGRVTLGTLDNTPAGGTPTLNNPAATNLYTNFTSSGPSPVLPPTLVQGNTYGNLSVTQITLGGCFYPAFLNVFIDYDKNGVFDPVYERVLSQGSTNNGVVLCNGAINPTTLGGSVTIPFFADTGITRMRVLLRELDAGGAANNPPCGTYAWGETEDYDVKVVAGPPCITPVVAGTAVTSNSNVCSTTPFTLTITGNTSLGSGQTWQWQSGTGGCGGGFTNIVGATLPFYVTTQATTTTYRCVITCTSCCSTPLGITGCVTVTSNPPYLCYCTVASSPAGAPLHSVDCSTGFVQNITVNTLNNTTGCSSGFSQAYTIYPSSGSTTTSLTQNQTYNLSVTTSGGSQSISVWFDFNASGTFDASEWFGLTGSPVQMLAAGTYTVPVTIPGTLATGLIGMRVRSRQATQNTAVDACLQFGSGETEDYIITIDPYIPPNCAASVGALSTISNYASACSGTPINLSLAPAANINFLGLTYQWQLDTFPGGATTWQNILGATNKTLTIAQARYSRYRCMVTCTLCACAPDFSAPVTVANSPATWLGGSGSTPSTDWNNGANWCGRVPTAADSVQISLTASGRPAASYRCPIVGGGTNAQAYYLNIAFGDSLTVKTDSLNGFGITQHLVNNGLLNISSTIADTIPLDSAFSCLNCTVSSGTFTPFRGSISDEIGQLIYDSLELARLGIQPNDVIDSLFFHFKLRASTKAYQGFKISFGFTSDLQFTSTTPYTGLSTIWGPDTLPLYSLLPLGYGTLKLKVNNFYWDGHSSLILQICFNTASQRAGANDILYLTSTSTINPAFASSFKSYLQLSNDNIGVDGCGLTMSVVGTTNSFTPSVNRPNITFRVHRPQKQLTTSIGTVGGGGGIRNNGSGAKLYISNSNMTVNGAVNNDGLIAIDSTNLTINLSAGNTGDFFNNLTTDLSYSPAGSVRKSTISFNGINWVNSGTLTGGNCLINWSGTNWTNNGTINPGTSRVVFMGTISQIIGGTTPSTFYDFRMQKGAVTQPITLNQAIVINDSLSLGTGRIVMNQKSITINNPAGWGITKTIPLINGVLISEDSLSKVKWAIGTDVSTHVIPFANAALTSVVPDTIINAGGTDLGTVSIATYATNAVNQPYPPGPSTDPQPLNNLAGGSNAALTADRYWIVSKTGAGIGATTLTFAFTDVERTSTNTQPASTAASTGMTYGTNPAKAQPWGQAGGWRTAPATQTYTFFPNAPTTPTYIATRVNNVKVAGYLWTYGNSNAWAVATSSSPLPIHLMSFTAKGIDNRTHLNWVTASEENNDYFTVQRTLDFNKIDDILRVPSHSHTSNSIESYEAWDEHPAKGVNYYRLLQTDFGGDAEPASDYVAVRFDGKSAFDILYINNETEVQVIFDYDSDLPVDYTVTDMLGKTIAAGANNPASPGVNILKLDASAMPHGMYLITLSNKDKSVTRKMVY